MNRFTKTLLCSLVVVAIGGLGLAWAHEDGILQVTVLAKSTESWDGQPLPAYPQGQPEVTILRIVIPAGERTSLHTHSVINAGLMLRGELVVHMEDGHTKKLKKGDTLIELVGTPHWGENNTQEDAEIVVFYAGIEGKANTHEIHQHVKAEKP